MLITTTNVHNLALGIPYPTYGGDEHAAPHRLLHGRLGAGRQSGVQDVRPFLVVDHLQVGEIEISNGRHVSRQCSTDGCEGGA